MPQPKQDINARIRGIASQAAPSMVPVAHDPPPPPEKEEEVPDLATFVKDRRARLALARLIEESAILGEHAKEIKDKRDKLTILIKQAAGEYGIAKAMSGEYRLSYYSTNKTSLDKKKLLALGVSPTVIAQATTSKPVYTLKVTKKGEEEEEEI